MGHAGAIVSGSKGTAKAKMEALVGCRRAGGEEPDRSGRAHGRARAGAGEDDRVTAARPGAGRRRARGDRGRTRRGRAHRGAHAPVQLPRPERAHGLTRSSSRPRTSSGPARSRSAGASAKLAALGDGAWPGIVVASAGNHAQAAAFAARSAGVPCEVYMPAEASISKADATIGYGASVHLEGDSLDDCVAARRGAGRGDRPALRPPLRRPGDRGRAGHARPRARRRTWRTSPW